jgi:hypothetical protein
VYGRVHDVLVGLCVYACCWVLGFAYADGRLGRYPVIPAVVLGVAAMAAGLWCWRVQAEEYAAEGLTDVPLATLLVSAGAVLLLLRAEPAFRSLGELRWTNRALRFLTDRTVTVVLWAGPAVVVTPFLLGSIGAYGADDRWAPLMMFGATWAVVLAAAVVLGWAERPLRWRRRRGVPTRDFVFEGNVAADRRAVDDMA